MSLTGSGFQSAAIVKLTGIGSDIVGTNTTVPNGFFLTTTFDLTGATAGVRNVVVTNPDSTTTTLTGGFTVEQGGAPQLWVQIMGRNVYRSGGSQQTFYITYGNRGTLDSGPATVSVSLPKSIAYTLGSANTSNQIISTGNTSTQAMISVALRSVATGSVITLPITLLTPPGQSAFTINASLRSVR
jgi:hypothetical protein